MRPVFSVHNPSLTKGLISYLFNLNVPGVVNAYNKRFTKEAVYFADSNLLYSLSDFKKIIKTGHLKIQFLFHPFQWVAECDNMMAVLEKTWRYVIREREQEMLTNYIYKKHLPTGISEKRLRVLEKTVMKQNGH